MGGLGRCVWKPILRCCWSQDYPGYTRFRSTTVPPLAPIVHCSVSIRLQSERRDPGSNSRVRNRDPNVRHGPFADHCAPSSKLDYYLNIVSKYSYSVFSTVLRNRNARSFGPRESHLQEGPGPVERGARQEANRRYCKFGFRRRHQTPRSLHLRSHRIQRSLTGMPGLLVKRVAYRIFNRSYLLLFPCTTSLAGLRSLELLSCLLAFRSTWQVAQQNRHTCSADIPLSSSDKF